MTWHRRLGVVGLFVCMLLGWPSLAQPTLQGVFFSDPNSGAAVGASGTSSIGTFSVSGGGATLRFVGTHSVGAAGAELPSGAALYKQGGRALRLSDPRKPPEVRPN